MFRSVIAMGLLGCAATVAAAEPVAIATIVEGRVSAIRAFTRFDVLEGARLQADDLVRTGKGAFLRVEYDDQSAIELGPDTLVQLNHPARRKGERPALYILSGWAKIASAKPDRREHAAFSSPRVDAVELDGVAVLDSEEAATALFTEQGATHWLARRGNAKTAQLAAGDFLSIGKDLRASQQPRPPAEFTKTLPRQFLDTLPFRYALFQGRSAPMRGAGEFGYAEVAVWLNAEAAIRRQFVTLWRVKADEPEFRAGLERDLALHPEWDPVLHPEAFEAKSPAPAASPAQATTVTAAPPAPTHD